MSVVADSSPLVVLAKLGCFHFLNRLFPRVYISAEVHHEVVIAGAGLPGSAEVSKAEWIEVKAVQNPSGLYSAQRKHGLGPGEMSTILLAKELGANPVCSTITGLVKWQRRRASALWEPSVCLKPSTCGAI